MGDLRLALQQVYYTNKVFWRNPAAAFFTFVFPLMFLVMFTALFGNGSTRISDTREVNTATLYIPMIAVFSVISACYTNIAISITHQRDSGLLKRTRATPLPTWAFLLGRVAHAAFVAIVLVVIVAGFGAVFYDAELPGHSLPAFLLTLVVGAAAFCSLGLAITAIIPNPDASAAVVNASILPLLFISQVFIPYDSGSMPAWMDTLSRLFPVRHFAEAMIASYFPIPGVSPVRWEDLLIVAAWGAAGLALAVRFFSWEPRR